MRVEVVLFVVFEEKKMLVYFLNVCCFYFYYVLFELGIVKELRCVKYFKWSFMFFSYVCF